MTEILPHRTASGRSEPLVPHSDNRRLRRIGWVLALFVAGILLWLVMHQPDAKPKNKLVPITVAAVTSTDMPIELKNIGTVTPINSVAVKSHVSGQILQIHFAEGQQVSAGQLLFSIDPRPLRAALNQAQADMQNRQALVAQADAAIAKDQALLTQAKANRDKDIAVANNAQVDAQRYKILSQQGAVSASQYEQFRTAAISANATVAADNAIIGNALATIQADRANKLSAQAQLAAARAVVQNAGVQLGYTSVTAPISGLAGHIAILNGNLVRQDTDVLVTINQIHPIYVSLTVPEQQFYDVRRYAAEGPVTAEVFSSSGASLGQQGRLIFSDNAVDTATGTIMLKVAFDNADQKLWPGQFVNVNMRLATIRNALVVPSQAVQTGQKGAFVWIVNPDKSVRMQAVEVGPVWSGRTVIKSGLAAGQSVVTDGQLQLTPKSRVSVGKQQGT
jgi:multidrug efflux system membrane fusion protein